MGETRFFHSDGDTVVGIDLDGDKSDDFTLLLKGNVTLAADDFLF